MSHPPLPFFFFSLFYYFHATHTAIEPEFLVDEEVEKEKMCNAGE